MSTKLISIFLAQTKIISKGNFFFFFFLNHVSLSTLMTIQLNNKFPYTA